MVTETTQDLNQGKIKKEQGNVEILSPYNLPVCNNPQLTAFRVRGAFVCHGPSLAPAADTTGSTSVPGAQEAIPNL